MLVANNDEKVAMTAERIFAWADAHQPPLHQTYGSGATFAGCYLGLKDAQAWCLPFAIYNGSNAAVEIQFGLMTTVPYPARLRTATSGTSCVAASKWLDPERLDKRPGFPLAALQDTARMNAFVEVFEWTLAQALEQGVGVDVTPHGRPVWPRA
jgi:hypothetical protein